MIKRHQVTIKHPPTAVDSRGQKTGDPSTVLANVPCSIEQLAGLELIRAKKLFAEATYRVELWGDPSTPIQSTDYLEWGSRTLHIGAVIDPEQTGVDIELLCKEEV